jgi:7-alpha-hydroxysteroid dehydrogenase
MSFSIAGKTAIVTGAANGIGLAIGRHFVEKGANVMFADIDENRLIGELGDVSEADNMAYFAGDLRERLTVANLLSATLDAFDEVDILINAVRRFDLTDPLDPEDDSVSRLVEQNALCAYRLTQQVARRMIRQAEGRDGPAGAVVNLGSIAAHGAHPALLGYSVAAATTEQLTRGLALALAPHRIRVNAVAFGSVMSASLQATLKDHRDYREEIEARTPLGRIAAASELVETVQFLASEASGFVTGQVITVDGGRSLSDVVTVPAH